MNNNSVRIEDEEAPLTLEEKRLCDLLAEIIIDTSILQAENVHRANENTSPLLDQ